jgi:hypothetical protein
MTRGFKYVNDRTWFTLSELQDLLQSLQLPPEPRVTVKFEDARAVEKALRRQKAIEAMKKLKGSGNGNLVTVLKRRGNKSSRFSLVKMSLSN